jgi:integrase
MFVLRWDDIDFARAQVNIRSSLGGTGEVTLPKNGKARVIVLTPPAADALRAMPRRAGTPFVFTTPKGTHFTKTTHYYYWRAAKLAAGRPEMDFYELRHFCATYLLELGLNPADVAVQLGHTDGGALVMDTYGHPSDEAARDRIKAAFADRPKLRLLGRDGDDPAGASASVSTERK